MAEQELLYCTFVKMPIHLLQMAHVLKTLWTLPGVPTNSLTLMLLQALVADEHFAILALTRLDGDTFANDALEISQYALCSEHFVILSLSGHLGRAF